MPAAMLRIPQIWAVAAAVVAVIAEEEFRCLLRAEFISICPWRLLRRPPKLPLQIRTAVRLIIRPLRGSVSETAVLTHIMPGSTVCILTIRPTAAVAATELFVSDKTANRKIRRIFCY